MAVTREYTPAEASIAAASILCTAKGNVTWLRR